MISRIYANDSRFKAVEFKQGLNVVLADRQQDSGKKDSRNGIGKTTLINILHFCLGSNLNRKLLPVDEIKDWVFFLDLEICGKKVTACRSIKNAGIVEIKGNVSSLPLKPDIDEKTKLLFYKLLDWRELLGACLFGIKPTVREKYNPSFRSLISYFVRVGTDAYINPFSHTRNQNSWQIQVANAFMLGLNWDHASKVQVLKDKNKAATALDKAIKTSIIPSKGELEAERVRLQNEIEGEEKALSNFKVHPKYYSFQIIANDLTKEIHFWVDKNLILQRKLSRYEASIIEEKGPDSSSVMALYEEAGLHFGDSLKKTLEQTKKFHTDVVKNRIYFLQTEIVEIKNRRENFRTR
jgi:uncharacterized protein YydD (DUF2326 family)